MSEGLERLLHPLTPDLVRGLMLSSRVFHQPAADPARYEHLLPWSSLEDVIATVPKPLDQVSVFKAGFRADLRGLRLFDGSGQLDRDRFRRLTDQGVTLGCSWLEWSLPRFAQLAAETAELFGGVVNCAFIASFGSSTGYPPHYDSEDLLLLQIEGRKLWKLYGPPVAGSGFMRDIPTPTGSPTMTLEMLPGDLLFVPSGLTHVCEPIERSLHVGINVRWPTALWLLRALMREASADVSLTEPIRPFAPRAELDLLEQRMRARLQGMLASATLDDVWTEFRKGLGKA